MPVCSGVAFSESVRHRRPRYECLRRVGTRV